MNTKLIIAICVCTLIVGATVFLILQIKYNQEINLFEESKAVESSLNEIEITTEMFEITKKDAETTSENVEMDSTTSQDLQDKPSTIGLKPFVLIVAPIHCKEGERYVRSKKKCELIH